MVYQLCFSFSLFLFSLDRSFWTVYSWWLFTTKLGDSWTHFLSNSLIDYGSCCKQICEYLVLWYRLHTCWCIKIYRGKAKILFTFAVVHSSVRFHQNVRPSYWYFVLPRKFRLMVFACIWSRVFVMNVYIYHIVIILSKSCYNGNS